MLFSEAYFLFKVQMHQAEGREGFAHKSVHYLDAFARQPLGAIAQEKKKLRKNTSTKLSF